MTMLHGVGLIANGAEKVTSTTDDWGVPLGTRAITEDGRVFRYAFAQGAIGAGQVCQNSAGIANHDMDLVCAAASVGDSSITVTLGATAATANQYKGGYIYINDGPGEGHLYQIQSHPAASSAATLALSLGDDVVREALTTSSLAGLIEPIFQDVEVYDADDIDGIPVGVAPTEVADNEYFWIQTWGPAAVLAAAAVPVLGKTVVPDGSTDGAVENGILVEGTPNTGGDRPVIGFAMLIAPVATDYGLTFLTIFP